VLTTTNRKNPCFLRGFFDNHQAPPTASWAAPRARTALLNSEGLMMLNNSTHEFERLLGKAALALWSDFPRDVQENPLRNGGGRGSYNSKPFGFIPARPPSENGASRKAYPVRLKRGNRLFPGKTG
jgi:hypothetical protein